MRDGEGEEKREGKTKKGRARRAGWEGDAREVGTSGEK
jgi:hypothetical protein